MVAFPISLGVRRRASPGILASGPPAAFLPQQWTLGDAAIGGALAVGVPSLPRSGGAAIIGLEYRLDGGSWLSLGGDAPGDYTITGLADGQSYTVALRAVNPKGAGPEGDTKTATPGMAASSPSAFVAGDWALADAGTGGALIVSVLDLPDDGGAAITGLEYRLDGGAWAWLGGAGTGDHALSGLVDGQSYAVTLRAVNAEGPGPESDSKAATPGTASGPATDPGVTAVLADGWRVSHAAASEVDPAVSPRHVVVGRSGFDANGAPVSRDDALLLTGRVRQPWPDQATPDPAEVALSDFVYQGDTITGVTNNSTRAAPKPVAMWLDHDRQRVAGGSFTARLAVAHAHARAGRPVAAVKFTASDGVATVETTVSAMTPVTYSASGLTVPHFAGVLDFAGLAADTLITIDAVIYPWVGPAFTISVDADPYPSPNLTVLKVLNDVGYGTAYAHVDAVAGSDGTGVASETAATAAANPFATIGGAAAAIQTYNAANLGRNDASGGVIRLEEGTHTHASFSSVAVGDIPLVIEAVGAKAATIYRDAGSSVSDGCPDLLKVSGVTLQRNASGSAIFLDNGGTDAANMLVLEDCTFDDNGLGPAWGAWLYRTGRCWLIGCEGARCGHALVFGTAAKMITAIGSAGECVGKATYHTAGCRDLDAVWLDTLKTGGRPALVGGFTGFCHLGQSADATRAVEISLEVGDRGLALVGNVIEHYGGVTSPAVSISADTVTLPAANVVRMGNTVIGARTNLLYNDIGTVAVAKAGADRFNVDWQRNTKGDVFAQDGTLVGNWPVTHRVGGVANAALEGASDGEAPGPGAWLGELAALGDANGTVAVPLDPGWADDRSFGGAGGGGGDYTPGPGHALPGIPAGLAPWSHDQKGRPVADDGSGVAGAVQPL